MRSLWIAAIALAPVAGCGARSALVECILDAECVTKNLCAQFRCVENKCEEISRTECNDGNPCTDDKCNKKTGGCEFAQQTLDLDKDGHRAPKPGVDPTAPGACGDDCDDTNPKSFPGNPEVCDGVDNDCDGIVDNGAVFTPKTAGSEYQLSDVAFDWAEPESAVRATDAILVSYSATLTGQFGPYLQLLDPLAKKKGEKQLLSGTVAGGSNTAMVWIGDRYGIAWSDRRDGNFELYFAMLDPAGKKMAPGDQRVTATRGFSIYPSITWTGENFVLAWQEEVGGGGGDFTLQGQVIDIDGNFVGDIVPLTPSRTGEQGPNIAAGKKEIGLVWVRGDASSHAIMFQPFDFNLKSLAAPLQVTTVGVAPQLAFNQKTYVVGYFEPTTGKRRVMASVLGGDGKLVIPPTDISMTTGQARDVSLLPLGDRMLFVYADDKDNNSGFELYARATWADLKPVGPAGRITNATADSVNPRIAFSPSGEVVVAFRDDRSTKPSVWVTSLTCTVP